MLPAYSSNKFFMAKKLQLLSFLWLAWMAVDAQRPPECFTNIQPSISPSLTCGNGKPDPGELCDDGNQLNGDGCDATCSAYDAFAPPCTLIGRNIACPFGQTVFAGIKSIFCNLRAVAVSPQGKYLILADHNMLLRHNLFTDDTSSSLSTLTVSTLHAFSPICSLHILPDASILTYECTSQHKVGLVSPAGNSYIQVHSMPSLVASQDNTPPKILVLQNKGLAFLAGVSKLANDTSVISELRTCIHVYKFDVPASHASFSYNAETQNKAPWVDIPCVVYNAFEQETKARYLTFDLISMVPKYIMHQTCVHSYISDQRCIAVYMENFNMQRVVAFIPENGGYDIFYAVYTHSLMDNALGYPLQKRYENVAYTLRGTCFEAEHISVTAASKRALGNVCSKITATTENLQCMTPFNNPFITDILSSQNLVPEGLVSGNTHWELSQIFANLQCNASTTTPTLSGALYYRKILDSVYGNTLPVDFVENPYTRDIIYITPTTVGLIGTKQFNLFDSKSFGYCKATNMIYCPPNFFGDVDTKVCSPCNSTSSAGYGFSVAWQINCALQEVKAMSSAPGAQRLAIPTSVLNNAHKASIEKYANFVSKDVSDLDLHAAVCLLLKALNKTCPSSLDVVSRELHNAAADQIDFSQPSSSSPKSSLINCLIQKVEKQLAINITSNDNAEYMSKWTTAGANILSSLAIDFGDFFTNFVPKSDIHNLLYKGNKLSTNETEILLKCFYDRNINKLSYWLSCSVPLIIQQRQSKVTAARRLLQAPVAVTTSVFVNENNALSLVSSTPVIFSAAPPAQVNQTAYIREESRSEADSFPMWTGIGIGIGGAVIIVVLLYCLFYKRK